MPTHTLTLTDDEHAKLDRVRVQQGLETIDKTIEWLIKSSVRRSARSITGRRRALYSIPKKRSAP